MKLVDCVDNVSSPLLLVKFCVCSVGRSEDPTENCCGNERVVWRNGWLEKCHWEIIWDDRACCRCVPGTTGYNAVGLVSDIVIFVLKRDVKHQLTTQVRRAKFLAGMGHYNALLYRENVASAIQKLIKLVWDVEWGVPKESFIRWGSTLAPPGKHGWMLVCSG